VAKQAEHNFLKFILSQTRNQWKCECNYFFYFTPANNFQFRCFTHCEDRI